jgi:hypothetical protein
MTVEFGSQLSEMVVPESKVEADVSSIAVKLRIREILDDDIGPTTDLLTRGFPCPRRYWEVGLERLRSRSTPPQMPRYGYILEANGNPVGVILLISSLRRVEKRQELFSNLSSWYVEPAYRSHATQLLKRAIDNKQSTYLSISPATHVRPIFEALGFRRYSRGQVLAVPTLARNRQKARTRIVEADSFSELEFHEGEREQLELPSSYGCISFCCVTEGHVRPFVFLPRTIRRFIPCAQLAYCRGISDLTDVAAAVGRYLLSLGRPFVLVDANGPISGLPGKYFPDATPKYYKGAVSPLLGDLTETEATIFGIWSPADR